MSKRYRLKVNLPDAFYKDIYGWNGCAYSNETRAARSLPKQFVEEMKSWFEIVEPERIEVSHFCEHDTLKGNLGDSWFYQFCLSSPVSKGLFPTIKEAIEGVLNAKPEASHTPAPEPGGYVIGVDAFRGNLEWKDDTKSAAIFKKDDKGGWVAMYEGRPFSQEQFEKDMKKAAEYFNPAPERDWEIVECYTADINITHNYWNGKDGSPPCETVGCNIKSVRRLSDNEVFTVGDELCELGRNRGETHKINKIYPLNGTIVLGYGGNGCIVIFAAKKSTPPKPQPLFVTEDGKEVCHFGIEVWIVNSAWAMFERSAQFYLVKKGTDEEKYFKYFSTEAAAKEYVLMNKPCLSVKDICGIWAISGESRTRLQELASSKQFKQ